MRRGLSIVRSLSWDGKLHSAPELMVEVLSPGAANKKCDREAKLFPFLMNNRSSRRPLDGIAPRPLPQLIITHKSDAGHRGAYSPPSQADARTHLTPGTADEKWELIDK